MVAVGDIVHMTPRRPGSATYEVTAINGRYATVTAVSGSERGSGTVKLAALKRVSR